MLHICSENLSRVSGIAHGFFGRTGGVSTGIFASLNCGPGSGDARENVIENRRRALGKLTANAEAQLLTLYQIHSADAIVATEPWAIGNGPQADAMATNLPGLALGVLTADCAPVLLADPEARVIGAAHAGWKGALAGVLESAIAAMERLGARRTRITGVVGPCIGQANYEVGRELQSRFLETDATNTGFFVPSDRPNHWRFDLGRYVAHRLQTAGIGDVKWTGGCTYTGEVDFFSFRRATHHGEKDYGRQLSAILLTR